MEPPYGLTERVEVSFFDLWVSEIWPASKPVCGA